jgi:hypothetical protein
MAEKRKVTFYEILVYITYGYFILIGLAWFLMSMPHFNYQAFTLIAIFAAQSYFRHKLTNLIIGIISLGLSIFMLLEVVQTYDLFAKNATADGLAKGLLGFCVLSIIMSIILIFSYTKLSFRDS